MSFPDVLSAVKKNGLDLQHAIMDLWATEQVNEVVLAAVCQNGLALGYAPEEYRSDYKVTLNAVQQNRGNASDDT